MPRYVALNEKAFKANHWMRFRDYRHLVDQHWVAIAAPEVAKAAAHLPLAFVRPAKDKPAQLGALLGLKPGENHCINAAYRWQLGYVPALLRAHPFRLLPVRADKSQRQLCVDKDSPWMGIEADEPFFSVGGQLAPRVKKIFTFLTDLEKHLVLTQRAVDQLDALDLLIPMSLSSVSGNPIDGVLQVDEHALNRLDDKQWLALRKSGGVAIAYAQLISIHQLPYLRQRALVHNGYDPEEENHTSFWDDQDDDLLIFDFDNEL